MHALMQQYGGWNKQYQHHSKTLGCDMKFSVFTPPAADKQKVPVSLLAKLVSCSNFTKACLSHSGVPGALLPQWAHM